MISKIEKIKGMLMGFCVGDALGVPVEFLSRESLEKKPLTDMICYGTHNQPLGTWSDDSSLTFCLIESLIKGYDLNDISNNFIKWLFSNYWTPFNEVFDVGQATYKAIFRLEKGVSPLESGGNAEYDNGNGSLMRISPLVVYFLLKPYENRERIIREVSGVTHAHKRAIFACIIYVEYLLNLIKGYSKIDSYFQMIEIMKKNYYCDDYIFEWTNYKRILDGKFLELEKKDICSSGYVVATLEAALWSFLEFNSYRDVVINAVNLGNDTDTIGAIAGSFAGSYWGYNDIPTKWIDLIVKKDEILDLIHRYIAPLM